MFLDRVKKMIRGIIFDFDGTLVTSDLNFEEIRKEVGIPSGEPILETISKWENTLQKEAFKKVFELEYLSAIRSEWFPRSIEFVRLLRDSNIKTGILTRNSKKIIQLKIEQYQNLFDGVLAREDLVRPKPDPEGVLFFLNQWRLKPDEVLMVGDYEYDLHAARNAGISGVWYKSREGVDYSSICDMSWNNYSEAIDWFLALKNS